MAEVTTHYGDGDPITYAAGGALTGGQVVELVGNMQVNVAGDASVKVAGVAARDVASGLNVLVFTDDVIDLVASGAIAAGDSVCAAAAGKVRTWISGTDAPASRMGRAQEAISNAGTGRIRLSI